MSELRQWGKSTWYNQTLFGRK